MEANELRIGNYFTINNPQHHPNLTTNKTILKIVGISMNTKGYSISLNSLDISRQIVSPFCSQFLEYIEPVVITEELLLKCGFEKSIHSWHNKYCSFYLKPILGGDLRPSFYYGKTMGGCQLSKIKYLHQLQNLYFALTGEELIINL